MSVENLNLFPSPDQHPILFEDIYILQDKKPLDSIKNKGVHLYVLCHGFQGNSFDMRLFKNNLALLHPDALYLCSKINEDFTDFDILEMGVR